jgi:hypothetical protein
MEIPTRAPFITPRNPRKMIPQKSMLTKMDSRIVYINPAIIPSIRPFFK